MAEKQCSIPFDRLSELPSNISQSILMLLPLRDMARTSILSKNWRCQWLHVPQLVFEDDPNYLVSREERYRYDAKRVLEILLIHCGPILKFTLDMTAWPTCPELDSIIRFLSRNGTKELTLLMPDNNNNNNNTERYKLSSSMMSLLNLRHLTISSCVLQRSTFIAINNIASLELSRVVLDPDIFISSWPFLESLVVYDTITVVNLLSIDAPNLKRIHYEDNLTRIGIMKTPILKVLWLYGQPECYSGNCSSDLMSLLLSLPLLEDLSLDYRFLEVLAVRDASVKLPKVLSNLRILEFYYVDLCAMDVLTSALWLIRSSPNLQKLNFYIRKPLKSPVETELYLKMQDRSNYSLLKLQKVKIMATLFSSGIGLATEISKFLLEVSPALETLYIEFDLEHSKHIDEDGYKKVLELACSPRVSPKAKVVYTGLELCYLDSGTGVEIGHVSESRTR